MKLELKDITLGFPRQPQPLLSGVNLSVDAGTFVAIVGRNGAGKSTLLKSLVGLLRAQNGEILVGGESLSAISPVQRARLVSFVSTESISVAHLRVWDVVAMGRAIYSSWHGAISAADERIIEESLTVVSMESFINKSIDSLSDGERGRVMIARALAQRTPLILLDEPTAFLDLPNRYMVMQLLRDLAHRLGKIVLLSTHELDLAGEFADRMWVVSEGAVYDGTATQMRDSAPMKAIFNSVEYFKANQRP